MDEPGGPSLPDATYRTASLCQCRSPGSFNSTLQGSLWDQAAPGWGGPWSHLLPLPCSPAASWGHRQPRASSPSEETALSWFAALAIALGKLQANSCDFSPHGSPAPITCVNTFIFKAAEPRWGLEVADEEGGSRGLISAGVLAYVTPSYN